MRERQQALVLNMPPQKLARKVEAVMCKKKTIAWQVQKENDPFWIPWFSEYDG
jgi:hypothetical protein